MYRKDDYKLNFLFGIFFEQKFEEKKSNEGCYREFFCIRFVLGY